MPANGPVAETLDEFLDRTSAGGTAQAQTPSGDKSHADDQVPEDAETGKPGDAETGEQEHTGSGEEQDTTAAGNPEAAETEGKEDDNANAGDAPGQLGQFERGVLEKLRDAKIPAALQKRIAKSFEKEINNRKAIAQRDEILNSKDGEIETLKTQLSEAGTKATLVAPAGPLAHLDTLKKLQAATEPAAHNLRWLKNPTVDFSRYFVDDADTVPRPRTAEQKQQEFESEQLEILEHQAKQALILTARQQTREKLKKSKPEFFNADHEDGKAFDGFFAVDPRTREDADEIARLYLKAKRQEEEEASGNFKYHRIDIKAARANGALGGPGAKAAPNGDTHANGANTNGQRAAHPQVNGRNGASPTLPSPHRSTTIPTRPAGKTRLQQLEEQATTTGHSLDDYYDARSEALTK